MTVIQLPVEHQGDPWLDRLQQSARRDWRSDEWDWDTWTFAGIPENPDTVLYRCGCGNMVPRAGRVCWSCEHGTKRHPRHKYAGERINEFNLQPFPETMRWEILCALQHQDELDLFSIRMILRDVLATGAESFLDLKATDVRKGRYLFKDMYAHLVRLKLTDDEILALDEWDVSWLRLRGQNKKEKASSGLRLSFADIDVPWVKEAVKRWIFDLAQNVTAAREALRMAPILCEVLAQRGNPDPMELTYSDFEAVWFGMLGSGSPAGQNRRLQALNNVTRHSQRRGITSAAFLKGETTTGAPSKGRVKEDELGRGLTESEADKLEAAIPEMQFKRMKGAWEREEQRLLFTTVFRLMRDTGRRPNEVMTLRKGCVQRIEGKPTLIYDNLKASRKSRRLPIPEATALVVEHWETVRAEHPGVADNEYLFPPMTYRGRIRHLGDQWFRAKLAELGEIAGVPAIPYDFRHAYAQRHADAGVPIDVLAVLLDHTNIESTRGYYTVSNDRKRTAIETVVPLTVGRGGKAVAFVAYEVGAVAVPFGNCSEPSNVKAGGKSCPIRFQCSGCAFYSTDPSYLPAMEDHVANLLIQLELYRVNGSAPFIVDGMEAEVTHYNEMIDTMKVKMADLDEEQRMNLESASTVLRRARGARRINVVAL